LVSYCPVATDSTEENLEKTSMETFPQLFH